MGEGGRNGEYALLKDKTSLLNASPRVKRILDSLHAVYFRAAFLSSADPLENQLFRKVLS